jgi:hypothetical protein
MTDIERFNLFWLCHAMTAPVIAEESYYFDGQTKKFFTARPDGLYDMIDLPLTSPLAETIKERLTDIDSEASEIVEIPRLNVQDKVAVQLLFLSKFPGVIHEEKLTLAVEQQVDAYGFVLDVVLDENDVLSPMAPYWDDFKLKTIQYYLEKFTGLTGITLKML